MFLDNVNSRFMKNLAIQNILTCFYMVYSNDSLVISYINNNVVITISWHVEKPGIVRTVYSGIFRHIQEHSAIFSYVTHY